MMTRTERRPVVPGESAIWVFILGDMLVFTAFFGQFLYARAREPALFAASQALLNPSIAALNTIVLLTGSLFVVEGVRKADGGRGAAAARYFLLALACAGLFGLDKVIEYSIKLSAGLGPNTNDFFMYYYMLTGVHCLHLVIGACFLARMRRLTGSRRPGPNDLRFIEVGASYWHLVDLLWVVLFPLLYMSS